MFSCEFLKCFKDIFWQNTSGWLLLVFICEFSEVFRNIFYIEHLWETAYSIVQVAEFQSPNTIKTISQVLSKHFKQEREVPIWKSSFI